MKFVLPSFLKRNQFYLYSGLVFLFIVIFLDDASVINQSKLYLKLQDARADVAFYEQELETVKKNQKNLLGSIKNLEKFGREIYLMKKEGETVFVLVDEEGQLLEK